VLRFGIGGWVGTWSSAGFPWGTLTVNVLGSLALGALMQRASRGGGAARGFLLAGLCGGFTTFSTFDLEMLVLLQQARVGVAAQYALASVLACVGGFAGGLWLAEHTPTAGAGRDPGDPIPVPETFEDA